MSGSGSSDRSKGRGRSRPGDDDGSGRDQSNPDRTLRKSAHLPDEDSALWSWVARSIEPLKGKARVHPALERASTASTPAPPRSEPSPVNRPSKPTALPHSPHRSPPPPRPPMPLPSTPLAPVRPVALDRKKARRFARGAEEIDARLDLHGLTQDEAHRALSLFLRRAHADGQRTVLVITGKGGPGAGRDNFTGHERGVLKRMVPQWLDDPELRPLVIGYSTAHQRHGGGGALYVMLRRRGG